MSKKLIIALAAAMLLLVGAGIVLKGSKQPSTPKKTAAFSSDKKVAPAIGLMDPRFQKGNFQKLTPEQLKEMEKFKAMARPPVPLMPEKEKELTPEELKKMFEDPKWQESMKKQAQWGVDFMYAEFLADAHLTKEQTEELTALLMEQRGYGADGRVQTSAEDVNKDIAALLGPEKYKDYQAYEASMFDRLQVSNFSKNLQTQGMDLTKQQSKQLTKAFVDVKAQMNMNSMPDPDMSSQDFNALQKQQALFDQQVIQKAQAFLSQGQIQALIKYQADTLAQQQKGLQMMGKFAGGPPPTQAPVGP